MVQTKLNVNPKARPVIVLLDIDGTLIRGSRLHVRTFVEVIKHEFNIEIKTDWAKTSGKTDSWILHDLLIENGVEERIVNERLQSMLEYMGNYYNSHINEEVGYILPGINQMLKLLQSNQIILGLVTGNIETIAHAKLKKLGITHQFEFGGYGHEDWDRSKFMRNAIERAIKLYALDRNTLDGNIFYVGDTPFDVMAARKANVKSIITLTGIFSTDAFSENPPDLFVRNFELESEINKFLNFIQLK